MMTSVAAASFLLVKQHFAKCLEQLHAHPIRVICGMEG